jgi:sugar phosphate isomerase/epimerase
MGLELSTLNSGLIIVRTRVRPFNNMHIKNGCKYHPSYCRDDAWIGEPMSRDYSGVDFYYTETKSGAVNMDGVLSRLHEDGYEGFCTLEPHTTRQNAMDCIKNDLAYLSKSNYFE